MTPATERKLVDGKDCFCCRICGEVLVRIEPNEILGGELNTLDEIVIVSHMLLKHGSGTS